MKRLGRRLLYSLLGFALVVLLAVAGFYGFLQTAPGKAWLAATLAQALSTPASKVAISGLDGRPPFELRLAEIRLADRDGTWLTLSDVTLSIDGAALLHGELAIRQLRAARAEVTRQPVAEPPPTSSSASLDLAPPRLPLDVAVDDLGIESVTLAPAVLGEPVRFDFQARGGITKGRVETHLALRRTDDKPGNALLDLSIEGEPAVLDLKGEISDPRGILAAGLLRRADRPPMTTHFAGRGPLSDWHGHFDTELGSLLKIRSDVDMSGQGQTYRLTIQAEARQDGLLPPNMAPLIGDRLALAAVMDYDGKAVIALDKFNLSAALGEISGSGRLDSTTQRVNGQLHLTLPDLRPVQELLGETLAGRLELGATIAGTLAAPTADLDLRSDGLHLSDVSLDRFTARLQLALAEKQGQRQWKAQGKGRLTGLARTDAPLPAALDRDFDWSLSGSFDEADLSVHIAALDVEGASLKLSGQGRWAPQGSSGQLALDIAELDRFADLAQLPALAGGLHIQADVSATPAGAATVLLTAGTDELRLGMPLADALLGPRVTIAGKIDRDADGALSASDIDLAGSGVTLSGEAAANASFAQPTGTFKIELPQLADLGPALGTRLQGRLALTGKLAADGAASALALDLEAQGIGTDRPLAQRLTAQIRLPKFDVNDLDHAEGQLSATAFLAGTAKGVEARLQTGLARSADAVSLSGLSLTAAGSRIAGKIDYSLASGQASGRLTASIADLGPWSALAGTPLKGRAEMTVALTAVQGQSADVKLEVTGLSLGEGHGRVAMRQLSLTAKAHNLLATALGQADLSASEVAAGNLQLGHAAAKLVRNTPATLSFSAEAKGAYRPPDAVAEQQSLALALDLAGDWKGIGKSQQLVLDRLTASLAGDSAKLQRPLHLSFGGGNARLEDLALNFAGGSVTGNGALEGNALRASLVVQGVALKPFGRLAGQDAAGTIDATAEIDGPASAAAGHVTLRGHGLKFMGLGSTADQLPPLDLELALAPAAGHLQLDGKISARGDQLIAASGAVPLLLSARPFAVAVPQTGSLDLHLAGDGKLEKLAQILPMGEDRITGDYRVALGVGGTPARPDIGGKIAIADASYLNQDYGTEMRGLALELTGNQSRLQLTRLAAQDSRSGRLEGSGDLDLAGAAPRLDFQARLTNFLVANSDEAKAPVDADIRVSGTLDAPKFYGRLTLRRSDFCIPDQLPPSIANLDVVEIDSRDPTRTAIALAAAARRRPAGPGLLIALDVEMNIPGQAFVRGHGLDSEWRGKLVVTGTSNTPSIGGGLNIVRGSLSLLGKDFIIRRGTIRFPTGSFDEPWVDLMAENSANGITAQATLTGSLAAPQLALTSTPQLPEDEILSRVLFGTDAGHLTASQGLQLAFAARAMASGGPGMLDRLRSTLGLDRLNIGSGGDIGTANGANAATPTLSGGKYVAPGVFVGAEQGTSLQSSHAKVEVDLLPHVTGYSSMGADGSNRVGLDWRMDY